MKNASWLLILAFLVLIAACNVDEPDDDLELSFGLGEGPEHR